MHERRNVRLEDQINFAVSNGIGIRDKNTITPPEYITPLQLQIYLGGWTRAMGELAPADNLDLKAFLRMNSTLIGTELAKIEGISPTQLIEAAELLKKQPSQLQQNRRDFEEVATEAFDKLFKAWLK